MTRGLAKASGVVALALPSGAAAPASGAAAAAAPALGAAAPASGAAAPAPTSVKYPPSSLPLRAPVSPAAMGIAVLAPIAAAYSSCSSSSLVPAPPRRVPSRTHIAAVGMSSRSSSFVAGGGVLAVTAAQVAARPRRSGAGGGGVLGCKCLFGLGVPELVVIASVAALVFRPKQLPEIGRNIGKTVKSFQQAAKEFETDLKKEPGRAANSLPRW